VAKKRVGKFPKAFRQMGQWNENFYALRLSEQPACTGHDEPVD
jgi:hypothetical protein